MAITLTAWEIITKQKDEVPLKDLLRLLPIEIVQKINKRIKTTEYLPEKPSDRGVVA